MGGSLAHIEFDRDGFLTDPTRITATDNPAQTGTM
jgi:hypothetical protein